jgi:hypothetical protein
VVGAVDVQQLLMSRFLLPTARQRQRQQQEVLVVVLLLLDARLVAFSAVRVAGAPMKLLRVTAKVAAWAVSTTCCDCCCCLASIFALAPPTWETPCWDCCRRSTQEQQPQRRGCFAVRPATETRLLLSATEGAVPIP